MVLNVEEVGAMIGLQLGIRAVSPQDRIVEDLGAESADIINIIGVAEDKYRISFDEADIAVVRTVKDLFNLIKSLL